MLVGTPLVTLFTSAGASAVRERLLEWEAAYRRSTPCLPLAEQIRHAPIWLARFAPTERLMV